MNGTLTATRYNNEFYSVFEIMTDDFNRLLIIMKLWLIEQFIVQRSISPKQKPIASLSTIS